MEGKTTYDEALKRLEAIVEELERGEALSMAEYKSKAAEAKKLLDYCQSQLTSLETDLNEILPAN